MARLLRTAAILSRRSAGAKRGRRFAPSLILVTDPDRTPDPAALAERLPKGSAVIHRTFGRAEARLQGFDLARVARERGLILLIGADDRLAMETGAHGVHLPERDLSRAMLLRMRHPGWVLTGAAHSARALRRAREAGLDAALASPVFASRSPSAGRPLGPLRLAQLVRASRTPIYALGGIDTATATRLQGTGVCGLAAVEGLARSLAGGTPVRT